MFEYLSINHYFQKIDGVLVHKGENGWSYERLAP